MGNNYSKEEKKEFGKYKVLIDQALEEKDGYDNFITIQRNFDELLGNKQK